MEIKEIYKKIQMEEIKKMQELEQLKKEIITEEYKKFLEYLEIQKANNLEELEEVTDLEDHGVFIQSREVMEMCFLDNLEDHGEISHALTGAYGKIYLYSEHALYNEKTGENKEFCKHSRGDFEDLKGYIIEEIETKAPHYKEIMKEVKGE